MTVIEFRARTARAPGGDFRIFLGRSDRDAELRKLRAQRDLLQRLQARGEWDVLRAVKDGRVGIEELERLVDQYGVRDYRAHLTLSGPVDAPSLDEHVETFLGTVEKESTRETYRKGLVKLREWAVDGGRLGDRDWHEVRKHHVQELKDALLPELARATVKTYMAAWSAFFSWARDREESVAEEQDRDPLLEVNPVHRAKAWVTVNSRRERWLRYHEYESLLEAAAPYMKGQYATLVLTGLRGGEFRNLPTMHVFPESHVTVAPWGEWGPKGWPQVTRGVRDIPVHQERLRPLLEEYAEKWAGESFFFLNPRTGREWSEGAFRRQFYRDCEKAGLETGAGNVTPHTTRHTFASWLAIEDTPIVKIAKLIGDTDEVTRKHYAHLLPTDLDRTVQQLFSAEGVRLSDDFPEKGGR